MKFEGRTKIIVIALIALVGVSGIIEALPKARESTMDLLQDAAMVTAIVLVSVLLTRLFGKNRRPSR